MTTDDLQKYFVTDRTKRDIGENATKAMQYYADQAGADLNATIDRALVVKWMAARTGRNADEVSDNLDGMLQGYFGKPVTASAAYDVIASNYDSISKVPLPSQGEAVPSKEGEKRGTTEEFARAFAASAGGTLESALENITRLSGKGVTPYVAKTFIPGAALLPQDFSTKLADEIHSQREYLQQYYNPSKEFLDTKMGKAASISGSLVASIPAFAAGPEATFALMAASAGQEAKDRYYSNMGVTSETATPEQKAKAEAINVAVGLPVGLLNTWGVSKVLGAGTSAFKEGITKLQALKIIAGLETQKAAGVGAFAGLASEMYSDMAEKVTSLPDKQLLSKEQLSKYAEDFLVNYAVGATMAAGSSGLRYASGERVPPSPWSPSEKNPPMDMDFDLLRKTKSETEIKAMPYGDMLLEAAKGSPEAREAYQALVKQDQVLPIQTEQELKQTSKDLTNEIGSEDTAAGVAKESSAFLSEEELSVAQKQMIADVEKVLSKSAVDAQTLPDALFPKEEVSPENIALRKALESEAQPGDSQLTARARKMAEEAWLPQDDRYTWALMQNALGKAHIAENPEAGTTVFTPGAKRTDPRVLTRLKSEAQAAHDVLFEKYFGELRGRADLNAAKQKFEQTMENLRQSQAIKLARNTEIQEALRARELDNVRRQRDNWKNRLRSTQDREKLLRQGMREVERLLPMELRGQLRKKQPPTGGFKTNGQMERFVDDYLAEAVHLENTYQSDGLTAKINDFIKRKESLIGKAETARKKLGWRPDELIAYIDKIRKPRTEADEVRFAELEQKKDLTPEEQAFVEDYASPRMGDNLSPDELRDIYANLKNLYANGKTELQTQREERASRLAEQSIVASSEARPDPEGWVKQGLHKIASWMRAHGVGGLTFADTLLTQWSGKRDNVATRMMRGAIEPSSLEWAKGMHDYVTHFSKYKAVNELDSFSASKSLKDSKGKTVRVNGKKVTLNEAMEWYALMKNEDGRAQLVGRVNETTGRPEGGSFFNSKPLTEDLITNTIDKLPDNAKALVDEYVRYNDEVMYPVINKWFKEKYGYNLPKSEYYFPLRSIESDVDFTNSVVRMGKPQFIKRRTGSVAGIKDFDFFGKENRFIEQAYRTSAFDQRMTDLRDAFFNLKTKTVIDGRDYMINPLKKSLDDFDPTIGKELATYFDDVQRGSSRHKMTDFEARLDMFRRNGMAAIIGFNPGSVTKVFASTFTGMRNLDNPAHALSSYAETAANFNKAREFMYSNSQSATVKERNVLIDQKALSGENTYQAKFQRAGYVGMRMADEFQVTALWNAKYKETLTKTHNHDEAVYQADKLIQDTQSSWEIKDMARWYREGNLATKTLLQFTNDANHTFNELLKDIAVSKNIGDLTAKALKDGGLLFAFPAMSMVMGDIVNKNFKRFFNYAYTKAFDGTEPDPMDWQGWQDYVVQDAVYQGITMPFQAFPVISDASQWAAQQFPEWSNENLGTDIPDALYKGSDTNQTLLPAAYTSLTQGRRFTGAMQLAGIPAASLIGGTIDKQLKEE